MKEEELKNKNNDADKQNEDIMQNKNSETNNSEIEKNAENTEDTENCNTKDEEYAALKDKYIRLVAEFDNYRKRTNKEKIDIINNATESLMLSLLEVLDDIDRADDQISKSKDVESLKTGVDLIFSKFRRTLLNKGLKEMEATGETFDPDLHEAVTEISAPDKKLKGKVIDTVQKGYYIQDKIIRHAKVVVGK
ncbi:MAG TPA: nucleotide exchange factor GrpE [Chitinophagaceae bacterium]|nr:nucleotide exchange factor GrpE [Chitinophagaceae bacterium]